MQKYIEPNNHAGQCPKSIGDRNTTTSCIVNCQVDESCNLDEKCCLDGCRMSCVKAGLSFYNTISI